MCDIMHLVFLHLCSLRLFCLCVGVAFYTNEIEFCCYTE